MTTQSLGNATNIMEGREGTKVAWEMCQGFGSIIVARVRKTGIDIRMILMPGDKFIQGDPTEDDIMIAAGNKRVSISAYQNNTASDQERFTGEGERTSMVGSIRDVVRKRFDSINLDEE